MRQHKQWAGWGATGQQAHQHYLVEPRHLAGGGDLRHVTEYLRASGWKDKSKTGGPLVFDSPDKSVRVGYDPFTQPGGWTISGRQTARQEAWHATFGQQTPVEIVAGLTDALFTTRKAHAPNVWEPLLHQGWETEHGQHFTARSPDGDAFVRFHQADPGQAHWWAGARNEHGRVWEAMFTPTTPMHLVQAFSTALADPQPVMRPLGRVPPSQRIRTTSVSVLPSQLGAWQQARIAAARAATWACNSFATSRAPTSPGAHSYTTADGRRR
ncbi:DUF317 domain-containing protein [Streptomyces pseudovenezuelae]|uniref:DUF317 domain-containing protein n=1 Tax=Streptomyces pseudovenezuelae TaxID=67350 RepID=UPI002E807242|nr:DUF317 domain-containing protein [Streptomyces pseudovenezuelae]WUA87599.1 DUF317 domain-containing protein [Streptomyces pseudovenezuelae]